MLWHLRKTAAMALLSLMVAAVPAQAAEVYLNGVRITSLKNAELTNCSVKFDVNGDVHILSPGYRIEAAADGSQQLSGQSDYAAARTPTAKTKMRYVLVYEPNPKVNFAFDVWINGKLFQKIGLDSNKFTVEMTQDLVVGYNTLRIMAKPGDPPPGGSEADTTSLKIYHGEATSAGSFKAKAPAVWELVRSAIDRNPLDRTYNVAAE
ncbi:MAG: hypothetical protein EXR77_03595 [Myxococcales bacterium]|nr:hypothetical protein [Myxococcales bacterium]